MTGKFAVLVLMLGVCGTADAYGPLRCKGKIIRPGATMEQIVALCGQPEARMVKEVPVRHRTVTGFSRFSGIILDEHWQYDRGWGRFPAILLFQDNTLKRIEYLRRRSGAR